MSAVPPPEIAFDQGVPWHYGDPLREQRALAEGRAAVDMSNHDVLTITGPERLSWLHSLTTAHVADRAPGDSALALILSPNGHVEHELHLYDDGRTTWVIAQPGRGRELLQYLERMKFWTDVELADVTGQWRVIAEPAAAAPRPGFTVPEPFASRGYALRESLVPADEADALLASYPQLAGSWAREALRAAALMPRTGLETDHRAIPNEMGWIDSAVHLSKGCYRGQETVAKVHNLGQPPRRLCLLLLDGSSDTLPEHGAPVTVDGRDAGWIGTAAQHYELGPIATAVLKRSVPLDAQLAVGDAHATIEATAW